MEKADKEPKLGKLEQINPREIWQDEARDFTPWLRDNIDLLGDALGIGLEATEIEGEVGSLSVDLIGKDVQSGKLVVIENQLDATDHDHLGKLLAYSAGRDASIVVWIARDFKDEHREALDWLNRISGEDQYFYGVRLKVVKIGNSLPAVNFDLVAEPSQWGKEVKGGVPPTPGERAIWDFFSDLLDKVEKEYPKLKVTSRREKHYWANFQAGVRGFLFGVGFCPDRRIYGFEGPHLRVELWIDTGVADRNKHIFDALHGSKEVIEGELGEKLSWERMEERRASRIAAYRPGSIEDSSEKLEELRNWAVEELCRFDKVFRPRLPTVVECLRERY